MPGLNALILSQICLYRLEKLYLYIVFALCKYLALEAYVDFIEHVFFTFKQWSYFIG